MLTSCDDETTLLVYRGSRLPRDSDKRTSTPVDGERHGPRVYVKTVKGASLTILADLLRDAAFMILSLLKGSKLPGQNWTGFRFFSDGLEAIEEFRQSGDNSRMDAAEQYFERAVKADPECHDALYCYGFLLLRRRKRDSIGKAESLFLRALETKNQRLKALAHTGVANCHIQGFHRLAQRRNEILEKAQYQARKGEREWRAALESRPDRGSKTIEHHPWIFGTLAWIEVVDEGTRGDRPKQRFISSLPKHLEAVTLWPRSSTLHNVLGWVLLKLAEWGETELPDETGLAGHPADRAEECFNKVLGLNPSNRNTHANLCLLYATPKFRGAAEFLKKCLWHGREAIRLDPEYINGHRDLALSLIRHGELDEAYHYYEIALRLAKVYDKDEEIIRDTSDVLEEMGISEPERRRWSHPDPGLREPP